MSIPEELERREDRLKKLAEARTKIEARAAERLAREQAEYEAKVAAREEKAKARGKKPGGRPPVPPAAGPGPTDQINLTDEDSRIMPVAGGGFEQCYNAQAVVAADSLLVVAADVVQAAPGLRRGRLDKQQLEPMLGKLAALPRDLGRPKTVLGDNGYFSAANSLPSGLTRWVAACAAARIEPLLALGRTSHHPSPASAGGRLLAERFAAAPPAPQNPTPLEAMAHRLATPEGKKLYGLRKHTPEPVFGIIKSVLGFRQFLLRGLEKVRGEWSLMTMAWNMKRIFALSTRQGSVQRSFIN